MVLPYPVAAYDGSGRGWRLQNRLSLCSRLRPFLGRVQFEQNVRVVLSLTFAFLLHACGSERQRGFPMTRNTT